MHFLLDRVKLRKFKWGTTLAAIITIVLYISIIGLIGLMFIPIILEQGSHLANINYDAIGTSLKQPISFINEKLHPNWIIDRQNQLVKLGRTSFETVFGSK